MNVISNNQINCELALAELYTVDDPEIGLNVVDLGLIYEINFDEHNKRIGVVMTLTSQFCPMGESIVHNVTNAVMEAFKGWEVDTNIIFEPAWDHSKISAEGLKFLNQ